MVYCSQCHWYGTNVCNAPENRRSTYRAIGKERLYIPSILNETNGCAWFKLSWMQRILHNWAEILLTIIVGCIGLWLILEMR